MNQTVSRFRGYRALVVSLFAAIAGSSVSLFADEPAWVERSNELSHRLVDALAEFQPEMMSFAGFSEFDEQTFDLGPDLGERTRARLREVKAFYEDALASEEDPRVRQDLQILIDTIDSQVRSSERFEAMTLPFFDMPQLIFQSCAVLLRPGAEAARRPAALVRLKRYTGLVDEVPAVMEQLQARYAESLEENPDRLPPYRGEVEQAIANAPQFIGGLRQFFGAPDLDPAETAPVLDAAEAQINAYVEWVKAEVLPRAREDFRLPVELYALSLKDTGVDLEPSDLIARAQLAYAEIRNEMQALAPLVAAKFGWPEDESYAQVINRLKENQIAPEAVEATYEAVIAQIEDIIRREKIVTLPDRPMAMRVASAAEAAAQPAPHMEPPPFTGGTGEERGTFVLTSAMPGDGADAAYDDFTFDAVTWTLTAHEGRPGHELQFAAMVERGVSFARSFFAFNSANVEGWALYAEAELRPYEPLEGQLMALQFRLLRAARAFLDPMLNLGLTEPAVAERILREQVCLSPAMTQQELDRYMFRSPGQATSYFYGYSRLMSLRAATEIALGDQFDRLAFNDFIISQGLLPPDLLKAAVEKDFMAPLQAKQEATAAN